MGKCFKVIIPGGKTSQLEKYCNQEIVFGIRPEGIRDEAIMLENYQQASFEARVEVTELYLGR